MATNKKYQVTLTARQIESLRWAIYLTDASYEGWSNAEKGRDIVADLARLEDVYNLLAEATRNS